MSEKLLVSLDWLIVIETKLDVGSYNRLSNVSLSKTKTSPASPAIPAIPAS